jgi:transcriptional regulator with XRE-family HTH domain
MKEKSKTAIVIGENITKARGEMRQKTLALKLYGDKKYQPKVSKIERGEQEPKMSELVEIANALNTTVETLQGGKGLNMSTILSLSNEQFSALVQSFAKEHRISGNALGKEIMGKSKSMGHKYLHDPIKPETREKVVLALGEEKVFQHCEKFLGVKPQEQEGLLMVEDPKKYPNWAGALIMLNGGDEVGAENAMWDYLTRKRGLGPQG